MKNLLDHGYVKLVDVWGSDERVVESARMSTQQGFKGWGERCADCGYKRTTDLAHHLSDCSRPDKWLPGDEKLLRYLVENQHATPFEFGGLVVEVQAPIFVFREWHRHRTQSYNEASARYSPLPDLNYIPTVERLLMSSATNRQAAALTGSAVLTETTAEIFRQRLRVSYENAQALYDSALADGVPKELARVHLPVGRYSRMRASTCLRNWLSFITLRSAPNAQWEIRQYSDAVGELVADAFPRTWALFEEVSS